MLFVSVDKVTLLPIWLHSLLVGHVWWSLHCGTVDKLAGWDRQSSCTRCYTQGIWEYEYCTPISFTTVVYDYVDKCDILFLQHYKDNICKHTVICQIKYHCIPVFYCKTLFHPCSWNSVMSDQVNCVSGWVIGWLTRAVERLIFLITLIAPLIILIMHKCIS